MLEGIFIAARSARLLGEELSTLHGVVFDFLLASYIQEGQKRSVDFVDDNGGGPGGALTKAAPEEGLVPAAS